MPFHHLVFNEHVKTPALGLRAALFVRSPSQQCETLWLLPLPVGAAAQAHVCQ